MNEKIHEAITLDAIASDYETWCDYEDEKGMTREEFDNMDLEDKLEILLHLTEE